MIIDSKGQLTSSLHTYKSYSMSTRTSGRVSLSWSLLQRMIHTLFVVVILLRHSCHCNAKIISSSTRNNNNKQGKILLTNRHTFKDSSISTQQQPVHLSSSSSQQACLQQQEPSSPPLSPPTLTTTTALNTYHQKKRRQLKYMEGFKHSLASGLAAALSKTLLAPFDTIKTMQQQDQHYYHSSSHTAIQSFWQVCREIQKRPQGFLELYSGLTVSAIGAMPSVGIYFGVYSISKQTLGPYLQQLFSSSTNNTTTSNTNTWISTCTVALSAAIGNTVASFSRVPYEVIKQKLQTGQYRNTWMAIRDMSKSSSYSSTSTSSTLRAFFPKGGISAQMMRDIPYAVFTLVSYETLRTMMYNHQHKGSTTRELKSSKKTTPWSDMMIGAIAGGIGSFLTNPMDVVKTRMQMDTYGSIYQGNVWMCIQQTYTQEGSRAFLKGSIPRLLHKVPANGAFFLFYEWFRHVLCVEEYSTTTSTRNKA